VQPERYTIVVRGRLSEHFATAFPGVVIDPGEGRTRLLTEPFDQSQLQGFLDRLWSFGLELVSVLEQLDNSNQGSGSASLTWPEENDDVTHDRP
jgi:hypothetical protein